mgnify:CR=1 FL=1
MIRCAAIILSLLGFVAAGCGIHRDRARLQEEQPLIQEPLRILVVGDPDLAAAIDRLQAEWRGQAGYELEVEESSREGLAERISAQPIPHAVLLPYGLFPQVAESIPLAEIPGSILEDGRGLWTGIFGTLRVRVLRWGEKPVAVPFGNPVFVLYVRPDKLEEAGVKIPTTWEEYKRVAEKLAKLPADKSSPPFASRLSDRGSPGKQGTGSESQSSESTEGSSLRGEEKADGEKLGHGLSETGVSPAGRRWFGALEPLGPGWRGLVLLARAAAYVSHRDNYSTFFSIDTMEALIDREPFVRALEELVAVARLGPPEILDYGPDNVREAFWRGECGMAMTWPTAAHRADWPENYPPVTFAGVPGSWEVFDLRKGVWEKRRREESPQVPLLGLDGRVGVVPASSGRVNDAFQFLFWASSEQAGEIAARLPVCTLYRTDQMTTPNIWVEAPVPSGAAIEYVLLIRQILEKPVGLLALPVPGREEYLAALDDAVAAAVRGDLSPHEALHQAAVKWEEITERLGRQRQLAAFRRSLGLR